VIKLAGLRIAIRHILYEGGKLTKDGRAFLEREQPDTRVFDHTHQLAFFSLAQDQYRTLMERG
jgi:hypothetical protein